MKIKLEKILLTKKGLVVHCHDWVVPSSIQNEKNIKFLAFPSDYIIENQSSPVYTIRCFANWWRIYLCLK